MNHLGLEGAAHQVIAGYGKHLPAKERPLIRLRQLPNGFTVLKTAGLALLQIAKWQMLDATVNDGFVIQKTPRKTGESSKLKVSTREIFSKTNKFTAAIHRIVEHQPIKSEPEDILRYEISSPLTCRPLSTFNFQLSTFTIVRIPASVADNDLPWMPCVGPRLSSTCCFSRYRGHSRRGRRSS